MLLACMREYHAVKLFYTIQVLDKYSQLRFEITFYCANGVLLIIQAKSKSWYSKVQVQVPWMFLPQAS